MQPPRKTASRAKSCCSSAVEQVVAPLDRRAQRPLALGQVAGAAGEQRQPLVEPLEELLGRERLDARGGELEREREVVEAAADLGDGLVGLEVGLDRARPREEEADRLLVRRAAAPGTPARR